jgi:DNA-directed RNA polymerase subunit beta'
MTTIPLTGPEAIAHALGRLDLQKLEDEQRDVIRQKKKTARPRAVRVLRILQGLKRNEIKPSDLMTDSVPVIPPAFRPFSVTGNTFLPGDSNELYRDLVEYRGLYQNTLKELGPEAANNIYAPMSQAVRALYGYGDSPNPKIKSRSVKGFFDVVTGTSPKQSFYQQKMLAKPVDAVSRGVIVPDADLDMNEVGLPAEQAWPMYGSHVQRRLVLGGMSPAGALRALRDRTPQAQTALDTAMKNERVVVSRAPAWHRFNVVGQRPRIVEGDAIRINTFISEGLGADYDGDTISVHLPSTPEAQKEVREKLMPDKMVWSVKDRGQVMAAPKHEQILGLNLQGGKRRTFRNHAEVIKALDAGEISPADEVDITE